MALTAIFDSGLSAGAFRIDSRSPLEKGAAWRFTARPARSTFVLQPVTLLPQSLFSLLDTFVFPVDFLSPPQLLIFVFKLFEFDGGPLC